MVVIYGMIWWHPSDTIMCLTDTQETIHVYLFQKDSRGKRMAPEKHMRFENLW
jgi:hypothetical protein